LILLKSKVSLKTGEIWKYGEPTNPNDRYGPRSLRGENVYLEPLSSSSQLQIKALEKLLIYGYFSRRGKLPTGNKIFR
jgi:hypothetical protein